MPPTPASKNSPMTVVVEYKIREENTTMDEWLGVWGPRGEDARDGEDEVGGSKRSVQ